MTVGGPMQSVGAREGRENLRSLVEPVAAGQGPLLILRDASPMAVMIQYQEFERWRRIDQSLFYLHGKQVFPEIARGALDIEPIVRGEHVPSMDEMRAWDIGHDVGRSYVSIGLADARVKFAEMLDGVASGRPYVLVTYGRLSTALIRPMEYDRLMSLSRIVAWFKAHGLDLANATDEAVYQWLDDFRAGRRAAADADEGSAIA